MPCAASQPTPPDTPRSKRTHCRLNPDGQSKRQGTELPWQPAQGKHPEAACPNPTQHGTTKQTCANGCNNLAQELTRPHSKAVRQEQTALRALLPYFDTPERQLRRTTLPCIPGQHTKQGATVMARHAATTCAVPRVAYERYVQATSPRHLANCPHLNHIWGSTYVNACPAAPCLHSALNAGCTQPCHQIYVPALPHLQGGNQTRQPPKGPPRPQSRPCHA